MRIIANLLIACTSHIYNTCNTHITLIPPISGHLNTALSRVRSFLPQLKHADSVLQQRMKEEPRENVDVENVTDGQPCIEMVPHDVDLDIRPFLHICLTLPLRTKSQVCIHVQLKPFYCLSTCDVIHMRKCTRLSPALPYCKRREAGRGPGNESQD